MDDTLVKKTPRHNEENQQEKTDKKYTSSEDERWIYIINTGQGDTCRTERLDDLNAQIKYLLR